MARLDRTGLGVLCGVKGCGMRLAELSIIPHVAYRDTGRGVLSKGEERVRVIFDEHWADRGDGVWTWTKRAQRVEKERNRTSDLGLELLDWTVARRSRSRPLDGKKVQANHGSNEPREVSCPSGTCGSRQVVDPQYLREQLRERSAP